MRVKFGICAVAGCVALLTGPIEARGQGVSELSPNAPRDRPVSAAEECQLRHMNLATQPYIDSARAAFPGAKARYQSGLAAGNTFFVTVRLRDQVRMEQVFLLVDSIRAGRIYGRVRSPIQLVQGYRYGQALDMPESEIVDWLIARPDGSEEGNYVGKFLDTYRPPATCSVA